MSDGESQGWNAAHYDDSYSFVWEHGAALLDILAPCEGERIVDLGCGTGHLTAKIAASGAEVVGVDGAFEMIEQATANYPSLRFVQFNAAEFDVGREFDAVFSNAALHWMKPPEDVANCISRALRDGGRLVAEFGGKGNIHLLLRAVFNAFEAVGRGLPEDANPWYFPSIAEYASLLESVGLEVRRAELFSRPTPLEGGEAGLRDWFGMFGGVLLERLPEGAYDGVMARIEAELRPDMFRDGAWQADYRRLRIVAVKSASSRQLPGAGA